MFRSVCTALLFAGLLAPAAATAAARMDEAARQAGRPPVAAPLRPAAEQRVSLDEAIRLVRERYGDVTIVEARTKGRGGTRTHRIRFLTDSGRVRTVEIDAATGEFR